MWVNIILGEDRGMWISILYANNNTEAVLWQEQDPLEGVAIITHPGDYLVAPPTEEQD